MGPSGGGRGPKTAELALNSAKKIIVELQQIVNHHSLHHYLSYPEFEQITYCSGNFMAPPILHFLLEYTLKGFEGSKGSRRIKRISLVFSCLFSSYCTATILLKLSVFYLSIRIVVFPLE